MTRTDEWTPVLGSPSDAVPVEKAKALIKAAAESRLQQSAYHGVRRVKCEFNDGVLTLRGCVSSYYLKQITQTLVRGMEGVEEISNRVDVT